MSCRTTVHKQNNACGMETSLRSSVKSFIEQAWLPCDDSLKLREKQDRRMGAEWREVGREEQ